MAAPNPSTGVTTRQIALNVVTGAWTVISATTTCYYAEAIEDFVADDGTAQGLEYQLPTMVDGTVTWPGPVIAVAPGNEPVKFGEKRSHRSPGAILGQVGQQSLGMPAAASATPICRMRSATGTATTVDFTEYQ